MRYDFDEVIDRSGTDALKVEALASRWGRTDLIPLWVADMEFKTPPFIMNAIRKRCENEILGYTSRPEEWYDAIIDWTVERTGYQPAKEEILYTPGIVPGLAFAVLSLTREGDRIMIQPPVYHPFAFVINNNRRIVVNNPLRLEHGEYHFDRAGFRKEVEGCKMFILCNPHNPGGKVWTKEELLYIAETCAELGVIVVSDEIHTDLTLPPHHSYLFSSVSEKARLNSVVFRSSSKAFNMPGLASAYCFVADEALRARLKAYIDGNELGEGHVFAYSGVIAAYRNGSDWLGQMLAYIKLNMEFLDAYLKEHMPAIKAVLPQASYLVFLDCRDLQLSQSELIDFFVDKAHLALNDGEIFGKEGIGFMRMNVACPRSMLALALQQLKQAYEQMPDRRLHL
ncbi:MAG: PatB family C-S lyase [Bacteroidales bacterium]